MLLRIAGLTIITGLAFVAMGWLDPTGPILTAVGALMGALDLEHRLEIAEPKQRYGSVGRSERDLGDAGNNRRAA